jgi:hypothetical protein
VTTARALAAEAPSAPLGAALVTLPLAIDASFLSNAREGQPDSARRIFVSSHSGERCSATWAMEQPGSLVESIGGNRAIS